MWHNFQTLSYGAGGMYKVEFSHQGLFTKPTKATSTEYRYYYTIEGGRFPLCCPEREEDFY